MINFADIIGQDAAVARLQRNLAAQRMPHAFLFAGPRGVGRRTTATALAKLLLCEQPDTGPNNGRLVGLGDDEPVRLPCDACDSCRMIEADTHGDFQLVSKELARYHDDASVRSRVMQSLGIPVIRQFIIDPVGRAPMYGRGKVYIVKEAELMTAEAQNSLLKTLEEPPKGVTIILLAQRPETLLPTTRSRCSLIRFGPLPTDFVAARLTEADTDAAEAEFWAQFTAGSVGRALQLAEAGMYGIKRDVIDKIAQLSAAGDAKLSEYLAKTSDTLAENEVKRVKKQDDATLSKNLATRQIIGTMLQLVAGAFRDAMTLATGTSRPLVNADQQQAVAAIAAKFSPIQLAEILEQLSRYEQLLWRNVNAKTVWDNVVITCASAPPLTV
ncbi:MAG: DNA polymerase III subunit [Phycisphaerae bacterium]|nr:DNA polymerase III subunit [Phycisphaerae bacterium]